MRVRLSAVATAVAAATLVAVTPVTPAGAGTAGYSISVTPTEARPGETVTVAGTGDCASVAYTVTLAYEGPEGPATATANGTTDASGEFSQPITVPDTAVAGEDADVTANVQCDAGAINSNTVAVEIAAHEGTLTVNPTSGPTGTQVQISGTNCYGGEVVVAFTDGEDGFVEVEPVTLNPDRTFTATWAITDQAGPGQYFFVAECPGTDYNEVAFTVTPDPGNPNPGPGPGLPPVPVPGPVTFTG